MANIRTISRPVAQAATNLVAWCAAIWGFEVTSDLLYLLTLAGCLGVLNFAFAYRDAQRTRKAEHEANELAKEIKELVEFSGTSPRSVDLKRAPASSIRQLVHETSARLHELQIDLTDQWSPECRDLLDRRFQRDIRPDAIALYEELCRRLGHDGTSGTAIDLRSSGLSVLQYGVLAGPRPAAEAAKVLESMARRLPSRHEELAASLANG